MSRGVTGGSELGFGDIDRTIRAIEMHHQVYIELHVASLKGRTAGLCWDIVATSTTPGTSGANPFDPARWNVSWDDITPDTSNTVSTLYRLLIKLDDLLTRVRWGQISLLG